MARVQPSFPRVFEENPRTMSFPDLLFFAYKYYFRNYNSGITKGFLSIPPEGVTLNNTQKTSVSINIGGDLMPYQLINPENAKNLWEKRMDFFDADIVAANLETPLASTKPANYVPELMLSDMNFNSSPTQFKLFNKGFDVLSVANNHALDMGYNGLEETLDFLHLMQIKTCGAGQGKKVCIKEVNGIRVGFLAFTYSLNQYLPAAQENINYLPLNAIDGCQIEPIIAEANMLRSQKADFIIAMLHCGNAYQPFPGPQTQSLFKQIAETTEVDCIIGGHPHNVQPLQMFKRGNKDVLAAYSLGDFIAYDIYQRSHLNFYLELKLTKNEKGEVELQSFKVHSNFLSYKNKQLTIIPFDDFIKNNKSNKACDLLFLQNLVLGRNGKN